MTKLSDSAQNMESERDSIWKSNFKMIRSDVPELKNTNPLFVHSQTVFDFNNLVGFIDLTHKQFLRCFVVQQWVKESETEHLVSIVK